LEAAMAFRSCGKANCKWCGKEFAKQSGGEKYCSLECSAAFRNAGSRARFVVFERDKFTCIYCGKSSIEDYSELHIDHIYPKSKGGKDIAKNMVTSCSRCNTEKHDMVLNDDVLERVLSEVESRNKQNGINPFLNIKSGINDEF
jgi:hypothetical protein